MNMHTLRGHPAIPLNSSVVKSNHIMHRETTGSKGKKCCQEAGRFHCHKVSLQDNSYYTYHSVINYFFFVVPFSSPVSFN